MNLEDAKTQDVAGTLWRRAREGAQLTRSECAARLGLPRDELARFEDGQMETMEFFNLVATELQHRNLRPLGDEDTRQDLEDQADALDVPGGDLDAAHRLWSRGGDPVGDRVDGEIIGGRETRMVDLGHDPDDPGEVEEPGSKCQP